MRVIFGLKKIKKYRKPVVALGVFDGLHLGHRRILKDAARTARRIKGTSIVVTFCPHPQREESLYSLEHRLRLIAELGIDVCVVIKFTPEFSKVSAKDFIKNILIAKIGAHYICVGKNFRFGNDAKGDFRLLSKLSSTYNLKLKVFDVIKINNKIISSTSIRSLVTKGDLANAQRLLSRPVSVLGTVIKGTSLGKKLGFPTANIDPHHEVIPPSGVYAVKIIFNQRQLSGICYIGTKPTLEAQNAKRKARKQAKGIEVYIFNFKQNIYGKYLEIQFIKKIRNERKFDSPQSLVEQIKKDIAFIKALSSRH